MREARDETRWLPKQTPSLPDLSTQHPTTVTSSKVQHDGAASNHTVPLGSMIVKGGAAAVPQLGYSLLVFFRVLERHKRQVLHDNGISRYSEEEEKLKGDETHPE